LYETIDCINITLYKNKRDAVSETHDKIPPQVMTSSHHRCLLFCDETFGVYRQFRINSILFKIIHIYIWVWGQPRYQHEKYMINRGYFCTENDSVPKILQYTLQPHINFVDTKCPYSWYLLWAELHSHPGISQASSLGISNINSSKLDNCLRMMCHLFSFLGYLL